MQTSLGHFVVNSETSSCDGTQYQNSIPLFREISTMISDYRTVEQSSFGLPKYTLGVLVAVYYFTFEKLL